MTLEALQFIFSSFWVWLGTLILVLAVAFVFGMFIGMAGAWTFGQTPTARFRQPPHKENGQN
jgi:ABC-type multidrug transport system permease subunit